jgi:hypothetical protein
MSAVVSKKGIKPNDKFICDDCGEIIRGYQVLDGGMVYYKKEDKTGNPNLHQYRCADCQEDIWANY